MAYLQRAEIPVGTLAAESVIAIADSGQIRRECLRLALAQYSPNRHVMEVSKADELIHLVNGGRRIDLVLYSTTTLGHLDLRQIEMLRSALPEIPLVVVADTDNSQRAAQILRAGARGFLPAAVGLRVLMGAIDLVLAGGVYVPSSLIEAGPGRHGTWPVGTTSTDQCPELTRRQRDVLDLISQGRSNKLIADALAMSECTVKAHVKQIIKRLNVTNRTQAALIATGHLVSPPPHARNGSFHATASRSRD